MFCYFLAVFFLCYLLGEDDSGFELLVLFCLASRARWKKEDLGGLTPKEKLAETLSQLLVKDPEAFISVGQSENEELEFLFLQTSRMRKVMQTYGKVLLLDHTYKINKTRMPVTILMTTDGHGNGRSVGYAFLANEKSVTIEQVISACKSSITEVDANKIKTVVIDKDYSELKAIKNVLPVANIQLCNFHVSRALKKKATALKENEAVKSLLQSIRYAVTEEEFQELVSQLNKEASEKFKEYFDSNWLSCPMAWAYRDKKKSINLGNNTNNRLECHIAKIKVVSLMLILP